MTINCLNSASCHVTDHREVPHFARTPQLTEGKCIDCWFWDATMSESMSIPLMRSVMLNGLQVQNSHPRKADLPSKPLIFWWSCFEIFVLSLCTTFTIIFNTCKGYFDTTCTYQWWVFIMSVMQSYNSWALASRLCYRWWMDCDLPSSLPTACLSLICTGELMSTSSGSGLLGLQSIARKLLP